MSNPTLDEEGIKRSAESAEEVGACPEPEPLPDALSPVPAFDARLLPDLLAPWVTDCAERFQCPADFFAIPVLVAAGSVIGRKLGIRPKQHDNWQVVPNLWGAVIGPPAFLKSPASRAAFGPLHNLEAKARRVYDDLNRKAEFQKHVAKAREEALHGKLKRALSKSNPTDQFREEYEAATAESDEPVPKRYIVQDATVEKLGVLLNDNPNGLCLYRDELSGFLATMDRQGHENDRAFYCEAWDGLGSYTYDRIGRGTLYIEACCVSIFGGIQPGPLEAYLREAFGGSKADGLMQRFQLAVYPDFPRTYENVDREPDRELERLVHNLFERLDADDFGRLEIERPEAGIPFVRFSPDAQQLFNQWRIELENRLRNAPDEHPVLLSHLGKYRSLVPSLALIFHAIDCVNGDATGRVSSKAMQLSAGWFDFLEAHARRIYRTVTAKAEVSAAMLLAKMRGGKLTNPFSLRQVYRNGWAGLSEPDEVRAAVEILEEHHWLKPRFEPALGGGKPKLLFDMHPNLALGPVK